MAHGRRRGELDAVPDTCSHLHGAFERVVRTVARKDASLRGSATLQCILGDKVDRAADTRTAELCRHMVLVDFDLLDIVKVDCPQVGSATARIVQGNPVDANQHVPRRNPADGHRLETAHAALRIALDSGKRRDDFRSGQPAPFPGSGQHLHVVRPGDNDSRGDRRLDFGNAQILHGGGLVNSNILGRLRNLRMGARPGTTQKDRRHSGFAE